MNTNMFSSVVLCLCVVIGQLDASAIPMWEYLSTQEKMSFLYSMFANQVESFCESSNLMNCNQELLKYGLNKLKSMPEEFLDAMDPYQRGANNIIWDSMMEGHALGKTTPKPRSTTTAKPNSYDDESFGDFDFGSESAASAKIDNVYRVPPPKGFTIRLESGNPQYAYPRNVLSYLNTYDTNEKQGAYNKFQQQYTTTERIPVSYYNTYDTDEKKGVYNRFQKQYSTFASIPEATYLEEAPLTGPMVVKVYPDGTPVEQEAPLPQDEDLRQYRLSKIHIPTF